MRLQPVHVDDVAEAITRILLSGAGVGQPCYELGGPRTYTYVELLRSISGQMGIPARLVPLPFVLWEASALLAEFAPNPPLTRNQVALMRRDNVASQDLPGLRDLQIAPAALEDVVSTIADGGRAAQR